MRGVGGVSALVLWCVAACLRPTVALEIIAHRGAQSERPENTLAAEARAQAEGADWLEADVIATKDRRLILSHDLFLEPTTDIAARFPARHRRDGHFYALDFTLAELQTLTPRARVEPELGGARAFPARKVDVTGARITTLAELLALRSGGGGFYLEPKAPRWHRESGVDTTKLLLAELHRSRLPASRVWLECFDPAELKRLRFELHAPYRQTQLIGLSSDTFDPQGQHFDFDAMRTPAGLRAVKRYADAIGPRLNYVVSGLGGLSPLVAQAHAAHLQVHPYTFQTDRFPFAPPLTAVWVRAFERAGVEALFTDQPGQVRALLRANKSAR